MLDDTPISLISTLGRLIRVRIGFHLKVRVTLFMYIVIKQGPINRGFHSNSNSRFTLNLETHLEPINLTWQKPKNYTVRRQDRFFIADVFAIVQNHY